MGSHFQMRALVAPLSTGASSTYLTTSRGVTNGRVISQSELDLTAPRTDCPKHLPDPPTDAEMAEITGRLLSPRHATHVSTGSGRTATDPAKPGQLTARQRRRIKGLAKATDLQLPELSRMDHRAAEAWLLQAEVMHRRMSQSGRFRRDEL